MKFQYGAAALLLATAFLGIIAGGFLPFWRALSPMEKGGLPWFLGVIAPILVPCVFIGYAVGRRALTPKMLVAFAISQAAAVGVFWSLSR